MAAKVWEMLKESYGTILDLGVNMAENASRATKYSDGMDFQEHITHLHSKWNYAIEKRANIKDDQFRAIIISSLPASWDYIVASLQFMETLTKLIVGLNVHWEHLKKCSMTSTKSNSMVLCIKALQLQNRLVFINSNCGHTKQELLLEGGWEGRTVLTHHYSL